MMKSMVSLACALSLLLLAGCGKESTSPDVPSVAGTAATAKPTGGFAPLKDNESLQGVLEVDFGKGMVPFRSLAKRISDDLGRDADRKLASAEGRKKLAEANDTAAGAGVSLSASDVSELAHAMAGQTISDSKVAGVQRPPMLIVEMKGKSASGDTLTVVLTYDANTLQRFDDRGRVKFEPAGGGWRDTHESDEVSFSIERFERNADGSFAIKGRFNATGLKADEGAKIKGPTSADGHFDFQALPFRQI